MILSAVRRVLISSGDPSRYCRAVPLFAICVEPRKWRRALHRFSSSENVSTGRLSDFYLPLVFTRCSPRAQIQARRPEGGFPRAFSFNGLPWWAKVVSNHRPPACKAGALPLSYSPDIITLADLPGGRQQQSGLREWAPPIHPKHSTAKLACLRAEGTGRQRPQSEPGSVDRATDHGWKSCGSRKPDGSGTLYRVQTIRKEVPNSASR